MPLAIGLTQAAVSTGDTSMSSSIFNSICSRVEWCRREVLDAVLELAVEIAREREEKPPSHIYLQRAGEKREGRLGSNQIGAGQLQRGGTPRVGPGSPPCSPGEVTSVSSCTTCAHHHRDNRPSAARTGRILASVSRADFALALRNAFQSPSARWWRRSVR
jgi:hypothetical protein